MQKIARLFLQTLGVVVIAVASVAGLLSGTVAGAMLIAWVHDGRLLGNDKPILAKAAAVLFASSLILGLAGWLHRRFAREGDDTFRVVPSRTGRPESASGAVFEMLFFIVLAAGLWTRISPSPFRIPILAGWTLVGFVGIHVHIFLHELGHLATAWALGFRLRLVRVGTGPLLWAATTRVGLRFVWGAWPLGGFTFAMDPKGRNLRLRQSLFIVGGPLVDGAIVFAGYRAITRVCGGFAEAFTINAGAFVAAVLLLRVAVSVVSSLVPHTGLVGGRRMRTDGALLLQTWLAPRGVIGFTGDPSWLAALQLLPARAETDDSSVFRALRTERAGANFRELQARLQMRLLK